MLSVKTLGSLGYYRYFQTFQGMSRDHSTSSSESSTLFNQFFNINFRSLMLLGDTKKRTIQEKQEISRRYSVLLLYLLRSPCYDSYSKWVFNKLLANKRYLITSLLVLQLYRERVIAILGFLNRYIPGSSLIIGAMLVDTMISYL